MKVLSIPYLVAERRKAFRELAKEKLFGRKKLAEQWALYITVLDAELKRRNVEIQDPELLSDNDAGT